MAILIFGLLAWLAAHLRAGKWANLFSRLEYLLLHRRSCCNWYDGHCLSHGEIFSCRSIRAGLYFVPRTTKFTRSTTVLIRHAVRNALIPVVGIGLAV